MVENKDARPPKLPDPETWVDQYGDYLYRFALSRIKDPGLAEELVQETFLAALNSQKNFKGRSSARTWLIAILKHKIVDQFRKKKPEESREDMEIFPDSVDHMFDEKGSWIEHERPSKWSTNPMKAYEQREFMNVFYRCLSDLPKRLSKAFLMRFTVFVLSSPETSPALVSRIIRAVVLLDNKCKYMCNIVYKKW